MECQSPGQETRDLVSRPGSHRDNPSSRSITAACFFSAAAEKTGDINAGGDMSDTTTFEDTDGESMSELDGLGQSRKEPRISTNMDAFSGACLHEGSASECGLH